MEKTIWKSENGVKMTQYRLAPNGRWLADVFMSEDGYIFIKSDRGAWSYKFCFGSDSFAKFILMLEVDYFAGKVWQSWNYLCFNKQMEKRARDFAKFILPALQEAIREDECNSISAL